MLAFGESTVGSCQAIANMKAIVKLMVAWLLAQGIAGAALLFEDTFDRANSRNIDASLAGITDNTGSSLAADAVYIQPFLDPNNAPPTYGVQDGVASNGGGAQILANQLQLAVGAGTSNAYINHNFVNSAITDVGGFTVSLDVTGYNQATRQQGGGFAVGMSAAEAASAQDPFETTSPSMVAAWTNDPYGFIGAPVGPTPTNVVSDFWIGLRGNNSIAWGGRTGNVHGVAGLPAKTGTISVDFNFADFNAGSTVNYEVFLNDVSRGTGSFAWSGTNQNHIGIDARDNTAVSFDNFRIETIPEASVVPLLGLGLAGILRRRR